MMELREMSRLDTPANRIHDARNTILKSLYDQIEYLKQHARGTTKAHTLTVESLLNAYLETLPPTYRKLVEDVE